MGKGDGCSANVLRDCVKILYRACKPRMSIVLYTRLQSQHSLWQQILQLSHCCPKGLSYQEYDIGVFDLTLGLIFLTYNFYFYFCRDSIYMVQAIWIESYVAGVEETYCRPSAGTTNNLSRVGQKLLADVMRC
jgi:hypothetical protein